MQGGDIQFYPNTLKQSATNQLHLQHQDSEMAVTIDKQGNERGVQEISMMGVDGLAEPSRQDTVIDESFAGTNAVDMMATHTQS